MCMARRWLGSRLHHLADRHWFSQVFEVLRCLCAWLKRLCSWCSFATDHLEAIQVPMRAYVHAAACVAICLDEINTSLEGKSTRSGGNSCVRVFVSQSQGNQHQSVMYRSCSLSEGRARWCVLMTLPSLSNKCRSGASYQISPFPPLSPLKFFSSLHSNRQFVPCQFILFQSIPFQPIPPTFAGG